MFRSLLLRRGAAIGLHIDSDSPFGAVQADTDLNRRDSLIERLRDGEGCTFAFIKIGGADGRTLRHSVTP